MSPLGNNVCSALLTVIYMKFVMEISNMIRIRLNNPLEARAYAHMSDASWLIFWPLFDANHWSWRLNVLVPVVMAVRLFYKVSEAKQRSEKIYSTCSFWGGSTGCLKSELSNRHIVLTVTMTQHAHLSFLLYCYTRVPYYGILTTTTYESCHDRPHPRNCCMVRFNSNC